jgi:glycosyltransferase involved in cell wall biosynthesis
MVYVEIRDRTFAIQVMRILFVSPYAPTPIRTRPYNVVRGLERRGHAITLATVWENDSERRELRGIEQEGVRVLSVRLSRPRAIWNVLSALPTRAPVQSAYSRQPSLASLIAKVPFEYDLIHIEHLRGVRYGLSLKHWLACHDLHVPIIWDSVDCITYLFEQTFASSHARFSSWVAKFELSRTRRYEAWAVGQFDRVLVTSVVDKIQLGQIASREGNHIAVVPNGVDLKYFTSNAAPREQNVIIFSGKMSYHANATAAIYLANQIMPLVWAKQPDAQLWIVGANPPRQVRELARRSSCNRTLVTGTVPDIRPYLVRATIAVAPIIYGAGIQNKVLEAMATGTPVVATQQAVSALRVRDGENVLIGRDAGSFARAVIALLNEPKLRKRIGLAGRQYVESNHDWNEMVGHLENVYAEEISKTNVQV